MDWEAYREVAERNANRTPQDTTSRRLVMCALGLMEEAGEVAGVCKKTLFHSHPFDRDDLLRELGDLLWYVTIAASTVGANLSAFWRNKPTDPATFEDYSILDHVSVLASLADVAANRLYGIGRFGNYQHAELRDELIEVVTLDLAPVLQRICLMASAVGTDIEGVAERNLEKLRKRYPNGFDSEHSIHRTV